MEPKEEIITLYNKLGVPKEKIMNNKILLLKKRLIIQCLSTKNKGKQSN